MNNDFIKKLSCGLLMLILGIAMIVVFVRLVFAAKKGRRVIATVVDVIEKRRVVKRIRVRTEYIHIYEYYDNLELRTYRSRVRSTIHKSLGTQETLYITEKDMIIEKDTCITFLVTGLLLSFFGGAFVIAAIISNET